MGASCFLMIVGLRLASEQICLWVVQAGLDLKTLSKLGLTSFDLFVCLLLAFLFFFLCHIETRGSAGRPTVTMSYSQSTHDGF